jgi:hypothetical protein
MANLMTGYLIAARAFFAAFARCRLSNTAANGTLVVGSSDVVQSCGSVVERSFSLSLAFSSSLFPAPVPVLFSVSLPPVLLPCVGSLGSSAPGRSLSGSPVLLPLPLVPPPLVPELPPPLD